MVVFIEVFDMDWLAGVLGHIDLAPIVYGVVMFMGIAVLWHKLLSMRLLSLVIDMSVFYFVFSLHGGTMTGGFSAMVAALLAGIYMPLSLRWKF